MRSFTALASLFGLVLPMVASAMPFDKRQDDARFTFFDIPTPAAFPCDLGNGTDGKSIWGQDLGVSKVFKIDLESGDVTEYDIPFEFPAGGPDNLPGFSALGGRTALACVMRPGQDGKMYAANGLRNQLAQIDPGTGAVKLFTPPNYNPLGNLIFLNDMWCGDKGCYFTQTTANIISFFDYGTEQITNIAQLAEGSSPVGMFIASDGELYTAEFEASKLARVKITDGSNTVEEFPVPGLPQGPAVIRAETQGKYVWAVGTLGQSMVRLDMASGDIDVYPNLVQPTWTPLEETVDSNDQLWISSATTNDLWRLDPETLQYSSVPEPDSLIAAPIGVPPFVNVAINYGPDNSIYFTDPPNNRVGKYKLEGDE